MHNMYVWILYCFVDGDRISYLNLYKRYTHFLRNKFRNCTSKPIHIHTVAAPCIGVLVFLYLICTTPWVGEQERKSRDAVTKYKQSPFPRSVCITSHCCVHKLLASQYQTSLQYLLCYLVTNNSMANINITLQALKYRALLTRHKNGRGWWKMET